MANQCRRVILYHESSKLLLVVFNFILSRFSFQNYGDMKIYQKEILNEKDFYREITRQIQESRGITMWQLTHHKSKLLRLLSKLRNYENAILDACLQYLESRKCFGEKKKRLLEAFKVYLVFLWRIEHYFDYLDWKSQLAEKIERLLLDLFIKRQQNFHVAPSCIMNRK